jgi:hypothetical protein
MNWRQWIGLKPTEANLANDLLPDARQSGRTGWIYDAADSSLRNAERVVNLPNMHREYARAAYMARPRAPAEIPSDAGAGIDDGRAQSLDPRPESHFSHTPLPV